MWKWMSVTLMMLVLPLSLARAGEMDLVLRDLMTNMEKNQLSAEDMDVACRTYNDGAVKKIFWNLFRETPGFFVDLCQNNPRGTRLFTKDYEGLTKSDPAQAKKIDLRFRAYCQYNPAFRLCVVCRVLANEKQGLKEAGLAELYPGCQDRMDPHNTWETAQDFEKNVIGSP